ncbi:hypothetical protein HK104_007273, partial [Borealophlyctis nickersoniae]
MQLLPEQQAVMQQIISPLPDHAKPKVIEAYNQMTAGLLDQNGFLQRAKTVFRSVGMDLSKTLMANNAATPQPKRVVARPPGPSVRLPAGSVSGMMNMNNMMRKRTGDGAPLLPSPRPRPDIGSPLAQMPSMAGYFPKGAAADFSGSMGLHQLYMPGSAPPTPAATAAKEDDAMDVQKMDAEHIMDVTSYAGFNIDEEESRMASQLVQPQFSLPGADRSKEQSFLNLPALQRLVEGIAEKHGIKNMDKDFLSYLALATEERMRRVAEKTIKVAKHRTGLLGDQFIAEERARLAKGQEGLEIKVMAQPPDVKKKLALIEKREKDAEMKLQAVRDSRMDGDAA